MLKPIGSVCNLRCAYCYYLEKKDLYAEVKNHTLSIELLEKFIEQYINSQTMQEVLFTWHGGETLMRSISFYRKAIDLQKKYAGGRIISNSIQTNGTLLTDEWCKFFKENNFLVGISIDGPQHCHDRYRKTKEGIILGEEEKIDVYEALKAITIYGAYQYFEDDRKGTIEEGKLADLVVLDKNPLEVDKQQINNIKVEATIKEGKIIYKLKS